MSAARYRAALIALTLCAFSLRACGLQTQSLWLDEVDAIAFASEPVANLVRKLTAIGENGPLYFLLYKGWIALAGTTEFGARYLSTLGSTLLVPLLAAVARLLFRRRDVAIAAATLAAFAPYYVWYGQDAKMYPLYALLALGAQYCFLRGWEDVPSPPSPLPHGERGVPGRRFGRKQPRWRWWGGYVLCSSLALYVHLFAALQIAANTAAGAWLLRSRPANRRGFAIATLLLIGPYVPLALWQAPVLLRGADVGYRPTAPLPMIAGLLEQLVWHVDPSPHRGWLLPLAAVLAWGWWRAVLGQRPGAPPAALVLGTWLLVPLVMTMALQQSVPVFRDRYLIPSLAPLVLLLARALVPGRSLAGLAIAGFVGASFGYGLLHRPPNPDFRAAARLVRETAGPGEAVGFLAGYAERPFRFYYGPEPAGYEHVVLPYTDHPGASEQAGLLAVARSLRGGRWLWIVRFEPWLWDSRDLVSQYLANRGAREVLVRDFNGVRVSRYELPP